MIPSRATTPVLSFSALLGLVIAADLAGQPVAPSPAPTEETVILSPFVVSSERDNGYQAASSLSGSRIRTDLADTAAAISVLTQDFLNDVAATDVRSALLYVANIETTANYVSPGVGATTGAADDEAEIRNPGSTRVRGLGSATSLRDFFATRTPLDSYNVDRIDIIRGPNSILFGLGSPAGAIETGLKAAQLNRTRTSIMGRFGSFASWRQELDHNQVLIKNRLAIRVAEMTQDWQNLPAKPQHNRDNRFYATLTARLTKTTTLKGSFEYINIDSNRTRNLPPLDGVSQWLDAGKPVWDPGGVDKGKPVTAIPLGLEQPINTGSPAYYYQNGNPLPFYATWPQAGSATGLMTTKNRYAGITYYSIPTVGDESLFPFRSVNFDQAAQYTQKWSLYTISLEQQLFKKLTVNLTGFAENGDNDYFSPLRVQNRQIKVDVNRTFPSGAVNPNFMQPYVEAGTNGEESYNKARAVRGTLAYELNLKKVASWLGQVWFTGVGEFYTRYNRNIGTRDWVTEGPSNIPFAVPPALSNLQRQSIGHKWYLGSTLGDPASLGPWYVNSLEGGFSTNYYDGTSSSPTYQKWVSNSIRVPRFVPSGGNKGENNVRGLGASVQWKLFQNRLILTGGIRRDGQRTANAPSPVFDANNYSIAVVDDKVWKLGTWSNWISGTTSTFGVVVKPTKWISLLYNQSETFQPLGNQIDLFSRPVAPPTGTGKDYGVLIQLFDKKLSLRAARFEGDQINSRLGAIALVTGNRVFSGEELIIQRLYSPGLPSQSPQAPGVVIPPYEAPPAGYPGRVNNCVDTSDLTAKGLELEMTYNPIKNLRFGFNAAKQETIETNTGRITKEFLALRKPFYDKIADLWYNASRATFRTWYADTIAFPLANATITEGRVSPAQRKWRWNAFGTYEFSKDSVLKGFSLGGALRWEDRGAIGYPIVGTRETATSDFDHPYYSGTTFNQDAWVAYTRKIFSGKVQWRIQLNVRNLMESGKLIAIAKNPNGSVGAYRIPDPTQGFITNTFSF